MSKINNIRFYTIFAIFSPDRLLDFFPISIVSLKNSISPLSFTSPDITSDKKRNKYAININYFINTICKKFAIFNYLIYLYQMLVHYTLKPMILISFSKLHHYRRDRFSLLVSAGLLSTFFFVDLEFSTQLIH